MFEDTDLMTAIITPFDDNNNINYVALKKLTERYLKEGNRGFVIGGTTGETPTLSEEEKLDLYTKFAEMVDGRVPIIAGVGSNNTQQTIEFTQKVDQISGINAVLVVVPYYNKPDQRRIMAHFNSVANNSRLPIFIYNVPGRTGVQMANETVVELAQNPNIIGIKQCDSMSDLEYLVDNTPRDFLVYSGEDSQALFSKVIGAKGVISVASHIYGKKMRKMYDCLYKGDYQEAGNIQRWLTPRMEALFMYPSPAPVKAVLNAEGYEVGGSRSPILPLDDEEKSVLAIKLGLASDSLIHSLKEEIL